MIARDKKGREIMVGDTLKIFHFIGAVRRKRHYMYRFVLRIEKGRYVMSCLDVKSTIYTSSPEMLESGDTEIVQGYGYDSTHFEDRERI